LNIHVLKRLEKALASNPEVNLLSLLPSTYSTRLENRTKITDQDGMSKRVVSNDTIVPSYRIIDQDWDRDWGHRLGTRRLIRT